VLKDGLYEQIISNALCAELRSTDRLSQRAPIDSAEAPKVLARYVAEVVERELRVLGDSGGKLPDQVAVTNRVLSALNRETPLTDQEVAGQGEQLLSLFDRRNSLLALNEKAAVRRDSRAEIRSSSAAVHSRKRSARAVGVLTKRLATISATWKSRSWPMAVKTGTGNRAMAAARA
jgi:hypothetical protein